MLESKSLGTLVAHLPHLLLTPGGALTVSLFGVLLHIDRLNEIAYLEISGERSLAVLPAFESLIHYLGFELMGEDECPSEELANGSTRTWLAERAEALAVAV